MVALLIYIMKKDSILSTSHAKVKTQKESLQKRAHNHLVGDIKSLRVLLQHNADINVPNEDGLTPLHAALEARKLKLAKELINAGADINKPDSWGVTPLHLVATKIIAKTL